MDPFWGLVFGGKWGPKTKMSTCLRHRIRRVQWDVWTNGWKGHIHRLVVYLPLWKYDGVKVSWDDEIPNCMEKWNLFQTTDQHKFHLLSENKVVISSKVTSFTKAMLKPGRCDWWVVGVRWSSGYFQKTKTSLKKTRVSGGLAMSQNPGARMVPLNSWFMVFHYPNMVIYRFWPISNSLSVFGNPWSDRNTVPRCCQRSM